MELHNMEFPVIENNSFMIQHLWSIFFHRRLVNPVISGSLAKIPLNLKHGWIIRENQWCNYNICVDDISVDKLY